MCTRTRTKNALIDSVGVLYTSRIYNNIKCTAIIIISTISYHERRRPYLVVDNVRVKKNILCKGAPHTSRCALLVRGLDVWGRNHE